MARVAGGFVWYIFLNLLSPEFVAKPIVGKCGVLRIFVQSLLRVGNRCGVEIGLQCLSSCSNGDVVLASSACDFLPLFIAAWSWWKREQPVLEVSLERVDLGNDMSSCVVDVSKPWRRNVSAPL
jgi:hypothetical protein